MWPGFQNATGNIVQVVNFSLGASLQAETKETTHRKETR